MIEELFSALSEQYGLGKLEEVSRYGGNLARDLECCVLYYEYDEVLLDKIARSILCVIDKWLIKEKRIELASILKEFDKDLHVEKGFNSIIVYDVSLRGEVNNRDVLRGLIDHLVTRKWED